MEYQCSACGTKVGADMLVYRDHINQHIVDLLKADHPNWIEKDGVCKKCLEYYESELKGSVFHDAPYVMRQSKIKNFFEKISGVFKGNKN